MLDKPCPQFAYNTQDVSLNMDDLRVFEAVLEI